jgi:hypothetical protein
MSRPPTSRTPANLTMDFKQRLAKAIERGERTGDARARAEAQRQLDEQEMRRRHGEYRLDLCEHVEQCLKTLPEHFPGFRFETVLGDRGWGAAVSRDDLAVNPQHGRTSLFSRLEVLVRPVSEYFVLELVAKGTIQNKEVFHRTHYQRLAEVDLAAFTKLIDLWVIEYAELYSAQR